jgi:hypothetical protein
MLRNYEAGISSLSDVSMTIVIISVYGRFHNNNNNNNNIESKNKSVLLLLLLIII